MEDLEKKRVEVVAHLHIIGCLHGALNDTPWGTTNVVQLVIVLGKLQREVALLLMILQELEARGMLLTTQEKLDRLERALGCD